MRLRPPSPAMIVASVALVLSTGGTAVAAVLISSPDQVADRVITNAKLDTNAVDGRALAFNTVTSSHLRDGQVGSSDLDSPVFSATLNADGTTTTARSVGVNVSRTGKFTPGLFGTGFYTVAFRQDVSTCSIAATAVQDGTVAAGFTSATDPRVMFVKLTRARISEGGSLFHEPVDGPFSLVVQC